jgi:hypothetical protein
MTGHRALARRVGGLALLGAIAWATPSHTAPPPKIVTAIYLVPADRDEKPEYRAAIEHALVYVRAWYWRQLQMSDGSSRTFALDPNGVRVVKTTRRASDYARTRTREPYETSWFYNAAEDATAAGASLRDGAHVWLLFPDADPLCDQTASAALPGFAVMPGHHLHGLAGEIPAPLCPSEKPWREACRYIGTVAHEAGHAFGLEHPAECPTDPACALDVMYTGRALDDPHVRLSAADRAALRQSPFFTASTGDAPPAVDCSPLPDPRRR